MFRAAVVENGLNAASVAGEKDARIANAIADNYNDSYIYTNFVANPGHVQAVDITFHLHTRINAHGCGLIRQAESRAL